MKFTNRGIAGVLAGLFVSGLLSADTQAAVVTAAYINANVNTVIYSDNFDATVNTGWDVAQSANGTFALDSAHAFGFDYNAGGTFGPFNGANAIPAGRIPAAPSGTGTKGLILRAQDIDDTGTDATQGIALFTNNLPAAPATPYAVRFDMWVNFVTTGASSGAGSSEFAFYGVGGTKQTSIGTLSTGATGLNTPPAPAAGTGATAGVGPITTGYTFATTGDGGFARDLRTFVGTAEQISDANFYSKNSLNPGPTPAAGTLANPGQDAGLTHTQLGTFPNTVAPAAVGVPGNQWLDVIIYYDGTDLTSYLNGTAIYTQPGATVNWGQMFLGYMDMNNSVSLADVQTFAVFDNFRVAVPEPAAFLFGGVASMIVGMIAYRRRKTA